MAIWINLIDRWSDSDINIRGGATAGRIAAFEKQYSVRLPPDVADYFRFVDGMDDEMCKDMYHFWRLEEIRPAADVLSEYDSPDRDAYPGYFVFADYMINSWLYAIFLPTDGLQSAPVRFVTASDPPGGIAADSFHSFIQLYCDDPDQLLL